MNNPDLDQIAEEADQLASGFNEVLAAEGKAVKEFEIDEKPSDYCHRSPVLDALDQVLAEHGFQKFYVVSYKTKPQIMDYRDHRCRKKMDRNTGRTWFDCTPQD